MSFYAVASGRNTGIFLTWAECSNSVKGYKNAIYKKFSTREEANKYININTCTNIIPDVIPDFIPDVIPDVIPDYYVYTDGACSNNGKINSSAGIGIFFGTNDVRNVSKKMEGKQTNNTAELTAIMETYNIIKNDIIQGKHIMIVSDSSYSIKCVTTYGEKCCKKNWDIDIPNKDLVKNVYEMYKDLKNVKFMHIKAHTNNKDIHSFGNYNADKLAVLAIK